MGLTANIPGESKSFLIWFRKRTDRTTLTLQVQYTITPVVSVHQLYSFIQAGSEDIKNEWVQEINFILYEQALRLKGTFFIRCFKLAVSIVPV